MNRYFGSNEDRPLQIRSSTAELKFYQLLNMSLYITFGHKSTLYNEARSLTPIVVCRNHSHKVPGSTGSRNGVEGHHFIKLWYEGGIPLWNDKLLCGT